MKLVIAEKPSVASNIAKVIGANIKEDGYFSGNNYIVSWCIGHLIENAYPVDYSQDLKKWSLENLPIFPEEWKTKISYKTKDQYKKIKELANDDRVEELIVATDAGREGELIFRLVYNQMKCKKPFKRLWISSMTEESIKQGFNSLKDGKEYDNLYEAAFARSKADWLVGINATRLYTCIYNQVLNVGRVQTPTINLIVKRQNEINNFISKPYFILKANCGKFIATKRVETIDEADNIIKKCDVKPSKIIELIREDKKDKPSILYNLTSLQMDANGLLGYTAQQTLDLAQSLYEKKVLTYPRTDSNYITDDMENETLSLVKQIIISDKIDDKTKENYNIDDVNVSILVNNKKVSDHHALLPTEAYLEEKIAITETEKALLNLVIYRLLEAVYRVHQYTSTTIDVEVEDEIFKASGKQIIDNGFKDVRNNLLEVLGNKKLLNAEDNTLPSELKKGDEFPFTEIQKEEKKTKPAKLYTEKTLLAAMDNAGRLVEDEKLKEAISGGLGTSATRAGIIEQIITKGFICREKKNLVPTEKAYVLMDLVPNTIKEPELTAEWEYKLEEINQGKRKSSDFLNEIHEYINELMKTANSNINKNAIKTNEKDIIGICPRCGKNIYEGKKNFYCESGKDGCGFSMWKEDKFFIDKKKELTKSIAIALLKDGKVKVKGLHSAKKSTLYDAYVLIEDTGKYVNYKLDFIEKKGKAS